MRRLFFYKPTELLPYINWIYFFHAWGLSPRFNGIANVHNCKACRMSWVNSFSENERVQAREAEHLHSEAIGLLRTMNDFYEARALVELLPAWSQDEDLIVVKAPQLPEISPSVETSVSDLKTTVLPLLRQQSPKSVSQPNLCLADFISPYPPDEPLIRKRLYTGTPDADVNNTLGIFTTSVHNITGTTFNSDSYTHMLVQTLSDRLSEAAAEKMHEEVRRCFWGYAPEEHLLPHELFSERYQGLRPAVGYPSLPDQSLIFLLDQVADFGEIGIELTENGMMLPHAATAGLMFGHQAAQHFSIGCIDETQFTDYAGRRAMPADRLRRFLSRNLRSL